MKSWNYLIEKGQARPVSRDLAPRVPRGALLWIHLDGRDPGDLAWLASRDAIPEAARNALTAAETRPRTEQIGESALLNLRGLGSAQEDDADELVSVRMWCERGRVVSVGFRTLAAMDGLREMAAAGTLNDPGDLVAALAVLITEALDPEIAALGDEVDDCEATLSAERAFAMRRAIAKARSTSIGYRRFVSPQRQALERLAALDVDWLEDDDRLHLREAADRFARMAEELEAVRERAGLLHEQLTDLRAEQTETRTLVLSIVALVFLPLTFISGLLGMNVEGIPFAQEPWAFWGVVGVCFALAVAITVYFSRNHWFRG